MGVSLEGFRITTMGNNVFKDCKKLTDVDLTEMSGNVVKYNTFNGCVKLKSVVLPTTPIEIEIKNGVFWGCKLLENINVDKINKVGDYAFNGCEKLITDKVNTILNSIGLKNSINVDLGIYVFKDCVGISGNVLLPTNTTKIPAGLFMGCVNLDGINFDKLSNLTDIGTEAFHSCALKSIDLSNNKLTTIPAKCFYDCSQLASIQIPYNLVGISSEAFNGCSVLNLSTLHNVKTLGEGVFWGCKSLEGDTCNGLNIDKVSFTDGEIPKNLFRECEKLKYLVINDYHSENGRGIKKIGNSAFMGCSELSKFKYTNNNEYTSLDLIYIGKSAFADCSNINCNDESGNVVRFNNLKIETIREYAFKNCTTFTIVNMTDNKNINNIYPTAFSGCKNVNYIDFSGCSGLTSADFLSELTGLTTIPVKCFDGCSQLTSIQIPDNLVGISSEAFKDCSFTSIDFSGNTNLTTITDSAFTGCTNVISVDFSGCSGLTSADFLSQLTSFITLPSNSFLNCENLNFDNVTFPPNLVTIKNNAFQNCGTALADAGTITINSDTLTTISEAAFTGCSTVTSVDFSGCSGLTSAKFLSQLKSPLFITLPSNSFLNCENLNFDNVTFPPNLKTIANNAFKNCGTDLVDAGTITINSDTLTTIDDSAFTGCSTVTSVDFSGCSELKIIPVKCFDGCSQLASIQIPDTLVGISSEAFKDCSFTSIDFNGKTNLTTITDSAFTGCINVISVDFSGCSKLTSAKFLSQLTSLITLPSNSFYNCENLNFDNVTFPPNLVTIKNNAFKNCGTALSADAGTITINSDKLTTIDDTAFTGCNKVNTIDFSGCNALTSAGFLKKLTGLTTMPEYCFSGCVNLSSVTFPTTIIGISSEAFNGCSFTDIDLSGNTSLTTIDDTAFTGCSKVTSVNFSGCNALTSVGFLKKLTGLTTMPEYCFSGCVELSSVSFPTNIKTIGNSAFKGCGLTKLDIPHHVNTIGINAFQDCSSLTDITFKNNTLGPYSYIGISDYTIPMIIMNTGTDIDKLIEDITKMRLINNSDDLLTIFLVNNYKLKVTAVDVDQEAMDITRVYDLSGASVPESTIAYGESHGQLYVNTSPPYGGEGKKVLYHKPIIEFIPITSLMNLTIKPGAFNNCHKLKNVNIDRNWQTLIDQYSTGIFGVTDSANGEPLTLKYGLGIDTLFIDQSSNTYNTNEYSTDAFNGRTNIGNRVTMILNDDDRFSPTGITNYLSPRITISPLHFIGELYQFISHTFTNCGETGQLGPTLAKCNGVYDDDWTDKPNFFNVSTHAAGYQIWTVPRSGTYTITAKGAKGGDEWYTSDNNIGAVVGGKGASVQAEFNLKKNDKYMILVGQAGTMGDGDSGWGAGGGGGGTFMVAGDGDFTAITSIDDVVIVAGGGGGGGGQWGGGQGGYGDISQNHDTSGGDGGDGNGGGNGGGLLEDGQRQQYRDIISGKSFVNGAMGGRRVFGGGGVYGRGPGSGGFGGGGAGGGNPGGGGGGIRGGNVGPGDIGGGGGYSHVTPTNKFVENTIQTKSHDEEHGSLKIQLEGEHVIKHSSFTVFAYNVSWVGMSSGYKFKPLIPGTITKLGGYFNGTNRVRLWNENTKDLLGSELVESDNNWGFTSIDPISVEAGKTYRVFVETTQTRMATPYCNVSVFAGSSNITLISSVYGRFSNGDDSFSSPLTDAGDYLYGIPDIEFHPS